MSQQLKPGASQVEDSKGVPSSSEEDSLDVSRIIWRISRMMAGAAKESRNAQKQHAEPLSRGDLAELRRISLRAPVTPALWRVLHHLEIHKAPYASFEKEQEEYERKWATLLMGMAHCAGLSDPDTSAKFHDPDIPFGCALAEAGWSELRFVRLVEAEPDQLGTQIRRVAQYLSSAKQRADWEGAYWLLFGKGDTAERTRLRMSRAYYSTLYRKQKEENDE